MAKSGDTLIKEVRERMDASYSADKHNRMDASEDLRFLAGDQWPGYIRKERQDQNRPCLTINKLPQAVHQVVNDYKMSPPSIKATPADDGTPKELTELANGLLSTIQYKSNAVNVYGHAFSHQVACGIGHFRITTDYVSDDSFDQEIKIKRIMQPLSVYWDPNAIEPTREDAEFCIVSEMISTEKFKADYPKAAVTGFDTPINDYLGKSFLYWNQPDALRIAEYWKKVPVKRKVALLDTGESLDITDVPRDMYVYLPKIIRERSVETFKIQQWLMSGHDILDGPNEWAGKYIPIIPFVGGEVPLEDKVIRYGLVRFARDPQQLYNFWRSAAAETIALAPRSPFLVTPKMIGKFKGIWDTQNTVSRPYLPYEPDPDAPGGRPERVNPPPVPAAFLQESSVSSDEMKSTTGIYDASLGQRSNETSGRAIFARDHQGDVGTYHFMDNANASLTHAGRVIMDLIPKIYDNERTIRLHTEDHEEPKFATINKAQMSVDGRPVILNDLSSGKFDIRVKLGPNYATRRMEAADSMMKFIQAVPQAAQVAGDLIAKAMDWPDAEKLAERLQRMVPPNILGDDVPEQTPQQQQAAQAQQQHQQMMEQMQQAGAQADIAHKQASAKKADAEAILKQVEAMMLQMQAQHGAQQQQAPQPAPYDDSHLQAAQSALKTMQEEANLRRASALADQAAAGTQGRIIDNEIKRTKLGRERYPLATS
jgi:hypothetical protein